jgi:UDP-galactopyranose mutase
MKKLTEKELCDKIDKILHKLEVIEKKEKLWGISEEERKETIILRVEYMKYYYKLIDNIFIDYIEPFLFTEEIVNLKQEVLAKTGWTGELLFEEKEIDKFLDNVDNYEEVIELIKEIKEEELSMVENFEKSEISIDLIDLFKILNSTENADISEYIELRYNIIISLLEGEIIEQRL